MDLCKSILISIRIFGRTDTSKSSWCQSWSCETGASFEPETQSFSIAMLLIVMDHPNTSMIRSSLREWPSNRPRKMHEIPSANQTWQWKMDHVSMIFLLKPPFIGDFPSRHVWWNQKVWWDVVCRSRCFFMGSQGGWRLFLRLEMWMCSMVAWTCLDGRGWWFWRETSFCNIHSC